MSRGLGSIQRDILNRVREREPTTLESLRWEINDEQSPEDNLSKSGTFALERALKNLHKRSLVHIEKRPLATVSEWLNHYPGKTRSRDVRDLRLELLPVLAEWVRSDEGPGALFSSAENERFHARAEGGSLSARIWRPTEDRGLLFANRWRGIEPRLRALLSHSQSDALFYLIARGKNIFTRAPVETTKSFGQLVDHCSDHGLLPQDLLEDLNALRRDFIPPEALGALELKSVIYRFVYPVMHGHPELKPEAIEVLCAEKLEYLMTIPGFKPPGTSSSREFRYSQRSKPGVIHEVGSRLKRLIDQTTFHKFHFLSLPPD